MGESWWDLFVGGGGYGVRSVGAACLGVLVRFEVDWRPSREVLGMSACIDGVCYIGLPGDRSGRCDTGRVVIW